MAYIDQRNLRDRPGAVVAVVAIHAMVGYALVTGLSFEKVVETVKNPEGIFVPEVELPPPPEPDPVTEPEPSLVSPPIHAPTPPLELPSARPPVDSSPIIVQLPDLVPFVAPEPTPSASASAKVDPVPARPRGDPGRWVTVDDYRSSWIAREWTGVARFRVDVGVNGGVETCTITSSSGHAELDSATCALIARRAQFEPAKDASGARITGVYASAVRWELPE